MKIPATVFFLISIIATGFSQESGRGGDSPRKDKKPPGQNFDGFIKHHDQDTDGRVSLEEFAAGERAARLSEEARGKIFDRLDKDGDGFISAKELKVRERGMPESFLRKADRDQDGRISREEFLANPPFKRVAKDRLNKMFDRMDQNKDGFLDKQDREAGRGRMRPQGEGRPPRLNLKELDTDQNGTMNLEEFRQAPLVKQMPEKEQERLFQRIDGDGDGEVSAKEIRAHLQRRFPKPRKEEAGGRPTGPKR